jgi:hypothetical protein
MQMPASRNGDQTRVGATREFCQSVTSVTSNYHFCCMDSLIDTVKPLWRLNSVLQIDSEGTRAMTSICTDGDARRVRCLVIENWTACSKFRCSRRCPARPEDVMYAWQMMSPRGHKSPHGSDAAPFTCPRNTPARVALVHCLAHRGRKGLPGIMTDSSDKDSAFESKRNGRYSHQSQVGRRCRLRVDRRRPEIGKM